MSTKPWESVAPNGKRLFTLGLPDDVGPDAELISLLQRVSDCYSLELPKHRVKAAARWLVHYLETPKEDQCIIPPS